MLKGQKPRCPLKIRMVYRFDIASPESCSLCSSLSNRLSKRRGAFLNQPKLGILVTQCLHFDRGSTRGRGPEVQHSRGSDHLVYDVFRVYLENHQRRGLINDLLSQLVNDQRNT